MKAKYIKKIRKKIGKYHPFVIHTAIHLFGEPYSEEEGPIIYALPGNGVDAVRKYCRWYRRKTKSFTLITVNIYIQQPVRMDILRL